MDLCLIRFYASQIYLRSIFVCCGALIFGPYVRKRIGGHGHQAGTQMSLRMRGLIRFYAGRLKNLGAFAIQ